MQSIRKARLESLILGELSQIILREIKDPRVALVTLTRIELSPDTKYAKIFLQALGAMSVEESKTRESVKALNRAAPFLRHRLTKLLSLRHIPELSFREDKGLSNTLRINEILQTQSISETGNEELRS